MRLIMGCLLLLLIAVASPADAVFREATSPAGHHSGEPWLYVTPGGVVYLSWVEAHGDSLHRFLFSTLGAEGWSESRVIAQGSDWFVNWADVPSIVATDEGWLAAHWLKKSGSDTYAYDIKVSQSFDGGREWSSPVTPHSDGTQTEHGFASLLPTADGLMLAWLDGRNFAGESPSESMTVRAGWLGRDGRMSNERALDERTCDCCPTAIVLTDAGVLVGYRDRSADEIRDITLVRYAEQKWRKEAWGSQDGWEIAGCPVNGPAIDASGTAVALAWFTMAGGKASVYCTLSDDGGATFQGRIRVDGSDPVGRVDVVATPDGGAVVCWIERTEGAAELRVRAISPQGALFPPVVATQISAKRSSGYPRIIRSGTDVMVAWTSIEGAPQVRTATAGLESLKEVGR